MIGIYKIENKINNKIYIGQSHNIENRFKQHKAAALKNNKNTPLYNDIRKYGLDNFDFSVIEECSTEQLNNREIYWISYYNSFSKGYNATLGGYGTRTENKPVYQYNLDGDYITEYENIYEAANSCGCTPKNIKEAIMNKKQHSTYNYLWSYDKKLSLTYELFTTIICFSRETGKRIRTYSSIKEASELTGEIFNQIKDSCNNHTKCSEHYIWRYYKENPELQSVSTKVQCATCKEVDQYDLEGNFIQTFPSIIMASKEQNVAAYNISNCCQNKAKSVGGYQWRYHGDPPPGVYQNNKYNHSTSSNRRIVQQYTINNSFITEYESAHAAARAIEKPQCANHIIECCQGKRKTCNGFIWAYKNNID